MKIGFIGCGKMGGALLSGLLKAGICRVEEVRVADHSPQSLTAIQSLGVPVFQTPAEAVQGSDVVLLCVKPNDAKAVLKPTREELRGKLLISILAGVKLAALQNFAGDSVRVARVMPNTPALIHRGMSGFVVGESASEQDVAAIEKIFGAVGDVVHLPKESQIDALTAVSGSGPAYVFTMIEALADGGVQMGLPRDLALRLAAKTLAGAAEMVSETGEHPAKLRDQVTSPGGTTIAGLEALEKNRLRFALMSAVRAATERARELGN